MININKLIKHYMDKEVKKRLRSVVAALNISNIEIAAKTGYSAPSVSLSLNNEKAAITEKFIGKFFDAYPDVKRDYREYILDGTGNATSLFASAKSSVINSDSRVEALTKEVEMLREQNAIFQKEITWFKTMLERAFAIQPDLQGKLFNPLTENGNAEVLYFNIPLRDLTRDYAAA